MKADSAQFGAESFYMIHLTDEQLKKLQKIELEMMIELDRICEKNQIQYTIIGGTLIGAMRNKGFIPWDDDVDIAMLRPEYERFRKAVKTDLDTTRFYFQDDRNTPGYRWGYGKLRRKDTLFLREHQEHMPYEQGVFLDIFPHDYVPDPLPRRALHDAECFLIRKMFWSEIGQITDKSAMKRAAYHQMAKIPLRKMRNAYYNLVTRSDAHKTKWVRALMFPTFGKEHGYPAEWFEPGEKAEFEGHYFQCMKGGKEYLTFSYGDYMELPPENERKVHPVSDIRLVDVEIA